MQEFKENLFNKVDMLEEQTRFKCQNIPPRYGLLKNLDKFDAEFFKVAPKLANYMDPQARILLEVGFEAMIDSGLNPLFFEKCRTGVYVGAVGMEAVDYWLLGFHANAMEGYGNAVSNIGLANRLSFFFNLNGPSLTVSTGCSASIIALEAATQAIQSGSCDAAIVAGATVHVCPFTSVDFWKLGALAPDGKCKTFDASGDGFARSEAVVAIIIQKRKDASRAYATVRHIQSNADGYKKNGFTYPSGASQEWLMKEMYAKAGIIPGKIKYIEAHGTGTPAGDPEELEAISKVFCRDHRNEPLRLGSVKSNMGHGESAAGICAIVKMLISFQEGKLPPNLHFTRPRKNTEHIFDGSVQVVTKTTEWTEGLVGINSFGIGGTNAHVILEWKQKSKPLSTIALQNSDIPLILPFSGRSEEGVQVSLKKAVQLGRNAEFARLIHNVFKSNITGHNYRGHAISQSGHNPSISVNSLTFEGDQRPIVFIFSGMGSQWNEMGKELLSSYLSIIPFRDSFRASKNFLKNIGLDLDKLLQLDNLAFINFRSVIVFLAAIQLALYDTMISFDVKPDFFIGHSFGEILCGYADGSFTKEEALLVSEARGRAFQETIQSSSVPGGMASVGLTWQETASKCPTDVYPACRNSITNTTISGSSLAVKTFIQKLQSDGFFAQELNSCGCAAHSPYTAFAGQRLEKYILEFYPNQKQQLRSKRWISSSILPTERERSIGKYNSAAYHANNVVSPVFFHEAVQNIPPNSVVIEIAPNGLLQGVLRSSLGKDSLVIAPMTSTREIDKVKYFLKCLGNIYNAGVNVNMSALYPPIGFPVSVSTPGLSNLINWDHRKSWPVPIVSNYVKMASEGVTFKVDLSLPEWKFLEGHKLDSRIVFPVTGYLFLAWQGLATNVGVNLNDLAVVFEDVSFDRVTLLREDKPSEFKFVLSSATGSFQLKEDRAVVVRGTIKEIDALKSQFEDNLRINVHKAKVKGISELIKEDVYKELRLRGCNYSGEFQGIQRADVSGTWAEVRWNGNWICFLDSILQTIAIGYRSSRQTAVPVRLQEAAINPKVLRVLLGDIGSKKFGEPEKTFVTDQESVLVPVKIDMDLEIISCPGVEVRGINATTIPRKRQDECLCIEEYKFIPYFDAVTGSVDAGIAIIIDLVLENFDGKTINIVDIFNKSESSMTQLIDKAISAKPRHEVKHCRQLFQSFKKRVRSFFDFWLTLMYWNDV